MIEYHIASREEFEARIGDFSALYERCFHQTLTAEEIRWRYLENPQNDLIAAFAVEDGRLAANYSVSPTELVRGGQPVKAVLSLNTMTHPDYMGRGLFVDLAKLAYAESARRGYQLVFGFPNYLSNRTFVTKLGWRDFYEIPMLELDLTQFRAKKAPARPAVRDDGFLLDYSACRPSDRVIAVRKTPEYLRWKFSSHPVTRYENHVLAGADGRAESRMICKEYRDRLNIVDYCTADPGQFECLLQHLIARGQAAGKKLLTLWCGAGTPEHLLLEKYGFRNNYPVTYFGGAVFRETPGPDYGNYFNWNVHLSDDNVY